MEGEEREGGGGRDDGCESKSIFCENAIFAYTILCGQSNHQIILIKVK